MFRVFSNVYSIVRYICSVKNATERIPEHLHERFKFHILQLPKVVQEILKYVSCALQSHVQASPDTVLSDALIECTCC